jgi:hypothetical protein
MTVFYVYAISDSPELPLVTGLDGAALSASGEKGIYAISSEHEQPHREADERALWEHERLVEALLEAGSVLPMRFGSWMRSQGAVLELLADRRVEFELGLEHVRGAVEIGVRALVHGEATERTPTPTGDRPGTAYMLDRLNQEKQSAAVAEHIHEPLVALSRASKPRRTALSASVNTAYLVDRKDVGPFRAAVEKLDDTVGEATIVCTGPWPPYSFTPPEPAR